MGYGAFLLIKNNQDKPLHLGVKDVKCMYDHGEQGSNLSVLDNAVVQPHQTFPMNGAQYIEANATGNCFFDPSSFTLTCEGVELIITERSEQYSVDFNENPNMISVTISNGTQAVIDIFVH